ncbi:MAG: hypothetical protein R2862_11275 [Thermoanaerobaculia bacterium]
MSQVRGEAHDLEAALAEEQYENDSLYPADGAGGRAETAEVFSQVVLEQQGRNARLEAADPEAFGTLRATSDQPSGSSGGLAPSAGGSRRGAIQLR